MAFSLGNIFKGLSGGAKEGSVLGIDIGASSAKIVQLRASRGVAVLETYGEIALGPYAQQPIGKAVKLSPEKLAEVLRDLMKESNVTASVAGVSIPFSSSLVSVISLPPADNEALKRIIPIEARKYIPVPVSEVSLDWFVIPHEEGSDSAFDQLQEKKPGASNNQEVLLVAIHNATLKNYQTIMENAGLGASFYEIEIFSSMRSALGHGIAPILIVDLGASTTKMYVAERGVIRMTHLLTLGGQHVTETLARSMNWEFDKAERVKRERGFVDSSAYSTDENVRIKEALLSTLSRVFSEVNRVLLSYGQRYNKNVSTVVLTGGGASLPGIAAVAKTSLNAEVSIADPFSHTEAPAFLAKVLSEIGPGFSVSVGLAMRKLKHN
ncbi:MAG: type IV pilus assembly protein PilM [Candidatus Kaiserbacteria bacterium]|nr:type IV pilus assembly protein PilM [Candidatus Kaiserbacteria bacterium]